MHAPRHGGPHLPLCSCPVRLSRADASSRSLSCAGCLNSQGLQRKSSGAGLHVDIKRGLAEKVQLPKMLQQAVLLSLLLLAGSGSGVYGARLPTLKTAQQTKSASSSAPLPVVLWHGMGQCQQQNLALKGC